MAALSTPPAVFSLTCTCPQAGIPPHIASLNAQPWGSTMLVFKTRENATAGGQKTTTLSTGESPIASAQPSVLVTRGIPAGANLEWVYTTVRNEVPFTVLPHR